MFLQGPYPVEPYPKLDRGQVDPYTKLYRLLLERVLMISRYTGYTKLIDFSVFPDSQGLKMPGFSVFPDSQLLKMTDDPIYHLFHSFHTLFQRFFFHIICTSFSHAGPEFQFHPPQYNRSHNAKTTLGDLMS